MKHDMLNHSTSHVLVTGHLTWWGSFTHFPKDHEVLSFSSRSLRSTTLNHSSFHLFLSLPSLHLLLPLSLSPSEFDSVRSEADLYRQQRVHSPVKQYKRRTCDQSTRYGGGEIAAAGCSVTRGWFFFWRLVKTKPFPDTPVLFTFSLHFANLWKHRFFHARIPFQMTEKPFQKLLHK